MEEFEAQNEFQVTQVRQRAINNQRLDNLVPAVNNIEEIVSTNLEDQTDLDDLKAEAEANLSTDEFNKNFKRLEKKVNKNTKTLEEILKILKKEND